MDASDDDGWTTVTKTKKNIKKSIKNSEMVAVIDYDTIAFEDNCDFNSFKNEIVNTFQEKMHDGEEYLLENKCEFRTRDLSDAVKSDLNSNGFQTTFYLRRKLLCEACRQVPVSTREGKTKLSELMMIIDIGRQIIGQAKPCMVLSTDPFFITLVRDVLVKRPQMKIRTGMPKGVCGLSMFKRLREADDVELLALKATSLAADGKTRPTRRLNNFTLFDSDRNLKAVEMQEFNDIFVSGFIKPSVVCSNKEKEKGEWCKSFGRIEDWSISGYEEGSPVIWISTELADYVCRTPAASYTEIYNCFFAKAFASVTVYRELCTSFGGDPDTSLDELLAAVVSSMSEIKMFSSDAAIKDFVISQGEFIYNQLAGKDKTTKKHGTSYAQTRVLVALRDESRKINKAVQMEGEPSSGVRSGDCGVIAFWDFENQGVWVPESYNLDQLITKINAALKTYRIDFQVRKLFAIGPRRGHKAKRIFDSPNSRIEFIPIREENLRCDSESGKCKNPLVVKGYSSKEQVIRKTDVADKYIMKHMILEALDEHNNMMLISGDIDFLPFIEMLRDKRLVIMLALPQNSNRNKFDKASKIWRWENIL